MSETICYIATCKKSGRRCVGITKQGLNARKNGHESAARAGNPGNFYDALRAEGKDNFSWEAAASGKPEAISLLEGVLIHELGTADLGGFNAVKSRPICPLLSKEQLKGYYEFAEEQDEQVHILHSMNDLNAIISFVEKHGVVSGDRASDYKRFGERLIKAAEADPGNEA